MLIKQLNEYLPRMLEASYNYLRRDPPAWYSEFYSGGDSKAARALASLVLRTLELEGVYSGREEQKRTIAAAQEAFKAHDYLGVIHLYMPELAIRWEELKKFHAEARASAIEYVRSDRGDDDDRDFNLRQHVSPEGWEWLRQRIRDVVKERGIAPRLPI
jgi:hypothetical protein